MIHFINNIGDYFTSNYFDDNFTKKVIDKSGFSVEAIKEFSKTIGQLKPEYFKLKQRFIENHLRTKDKINLSNAFHSKILSALGYDVACDQYEKPFYINDKSVLPVRQILYRGAKPHLMVMEMHAMIKTSDEEPDGLFEQAYNSNNDLEDKFSKEQKYHRAQWADIFTVPEGVSISPMIINQAINELFLMPENSRPKYVLLLAGNQYFLLESDKWFRGSYLQLDLEALFDDAAINKDYYAVFYLLLGKKLLAPTADMILMEQLEEDAHKAAYEVTQDLKEGVIHAVECLANEAVFNWTAQGFNQDEIDATKLKDDCLNMVYRLLFLFYAESREDLDILPSNDEVYEHGYSLEMLRDLEQVPLVTESSINGYFFHESLFQLFKLLNSGYREHDGVNKSFKIRHLDSPMFAPENLHYLNRVKIRNQVWQDVICQLSLSKKQNKKDRGRISYANLGINQLGSVYESLLAFRGFLAETDYIEVHRKRKKNENSEQVVRTDGSYLVPRFRLDDFDHNEVYHTEKADDTEELKVIPKGTFIYRLSGRDRQKSASYYTPEVLTQTTVKYTLKPILERLDKGEMKALDLLDLKILEPAMGAAAFHNEAINQLAQAYLTYRQQEMKKQVDPNQYQQEIQKIKAYIALNNVYGVDLNPTAVELGKLSLWLNVIHKDMQTPFFGYRLGVGNAVVGSWLKVYKHKDFSFEAKGATGFVKKEWWYTAPKHLEFGKKGVLRAADEIYHFLLPDVGMASSGGIKLLKESYAAEAKRVTDWRKTFCEPLRKEEFEQLQKIANAVDALLLEHYEIQKNIGLVTRANTDFFGNQEEVLTFDFQSYSYEQKQAFAENRLKPNAPYHKLKQLMDYWCSLWFWDVRDAKDLPTRAEWYSDLVQILNIDLDDIHEVNTEDENAIRDYRKDKRAIAKQLTDALKQSSSSLFVNDRAVLVAKYAEQYKFFHYELEFIEVFRERNGFDIAVGNPPWLKVTFEEKGLMSEIYPELEIRKISASNVKKLQSEFLNNNDQKLIYFEENIETEAVSFFMKAHQNYPLLKGQQTNIYKCILFNGLILIRKEGFLGLIHPESVYDDPNGQEFRKVLYKKLKYHFQFVNTLKLFSEILHWVTYGINIYGENGDLIDFYSINNLYHPSTIELSLKTKSIEPCEGLKIKTETGYTWNTKPHQDRVININESTLKILSKFSGDINEWFSNKLLSIHSTQVISIIDKIGSLDSKIANIESKTSMGFDENKAQELNHIRKETKQGSIEKSNFVLNGPHFYVNNIFYNTPRQECNKPLDYDSIVLSKIDENFCSRSNFHLNEKLKSINKEELNFKSIWDQYKIVFSRRLSLSGERTLQSCIVPPNVSHVNSVISLTVFNQNELIYLGSLLGSIVYDFYLKTIGRGDLYDFVLKDVPIPRVIDSKISKLLKNRTLLLNCLSIHYSALWKNLYNGDITEDSWSIEDSRLKAFSDLTLEWTSTTPLRNYFERRMALVEIDVITAMALNLNLEELILMYNIQFPVLQQNEDDTWYDTKGNIVFTCSKGLVGVGLDRADWDKIKELPGGETHEHTITKSELYQGEKVTYYAPFTKCDRVEDYKKAWAHFEERFNEEK